MNKDIAIYMYALKLFHHESTKDDAMDWNPSETTEKVTWQEKDYVSIGTGKEKEEAGPSETSTSSSLKQCKKQCRHYKYKCGLLLCILFVMAMEFGYRIIKDLNTEQTIEKITAKLNTWLSSSD